MVLPSPVSVGVMSGEVAGGKEALTSTESSHVGGSLCVDIVDLPTIVLEM